MRHIGYSTGAISLGDFRNALRVLSVHEFDAVELSALRFSEVSPLIEAIESLDLTNYAYVSFHAPSKFCGADESELVSLLDRLPSSWPIVVHPDSIVNFSLWQPLGDRIAIENMDKRKTVGRTRVELQKTFEKLPSARMCFDIGHARQFDASMSEAFLILKAFGNRIVQLHVSEVDTANRHERISYAAEVAYRQVAKFVPANASLILESRVDEAQILSEAQRVSTIFGARSVENNASRDDNEWITTFRSRTLFAQA